MAYSFEGISTHPKRKIKPEPCYEDVYGVPCEGKVNESIAFMDLDMIKAREPLKIIFVDGHEIQEK